MNRYQRAGIALLVIGVALAIRSTVVDQGSEAYTVLLIMMWFALILGAVIFTEDER